MPAALLVVMGASMALSAYQQHKAGNAAKKAGELQQDSAESQAQLSDYNAAVADVQAKDAEDRGQIDANRFRARTRSVIGEQRVGFAAGNIDVGFGSAVDVQADATFLGELDALTIRTNAAREAWGMKVEGTDLRKRAEIQRKEGANAALAGKEAKNASNWAVAGTLVSGTGSLLMAKYGMKNS
jgi:hypothetical protein